METLQLIRRALGLNLPYKSRLILAHVSRQGSTPIFKVQLHQGELARLIGCSLPTIRHHLRLLKQFMKPVRTSGRARSITYQVDLTPLLPQPAQMGSSEQESSIFPQGKEHLLQSDIDELNQEVIPEAELCLEREKVGFPQRTEPVIVQGLLGDIEVCVTPITRARAEEVILSKSSLFLPTEEREDKNNKYNPTAVAVPAEPETATDLLTHGELDGGPCEAFTPGLPCPHVAASAQRIQIALGKDHEFSPGANLHVFVHRYGIEDTVRLVVYLLKYNHNPQFILSGGAFCLKAGKDERTKAHLTAARRDIPAGVTTVPKPQPQPKPANTKPEKNEYGNVIRPQPNLSYYLTDGEKKAKAETYQARHNDAVAEHRRARMEQINSCSHSVVADKGAYWLCGDCWVKFTPEQAAAKGFKED